MTDFGWVPPLERIVGWEQSKADMGSLRLEATRAMDLPFICHSAMVSSDFWKCQPESEKLSTRFWCIKWYIGFVAIAVSSASHISHHCGSWWRLLQVITVVPRGSPAADTLQGMVWWPPQLIHSLLFACHHSNVHKPIWQNRPWHFVLPTP